MDITETLKKRKNNYGPFSEQSKQEQIIKDAFGRGKNWTELRDDQRSALEMVAVKISRILTGDMLHYDSWHDIEGYIRLISDTLDECTVYMGKPQTPETLI
jgi:hypothetical protein